MIVGDRLLRMAVKGPDRTAPETLQPPVKGHTGAVRAEAAVPLPDGQTLLASGGDGTVRTDVRSIHPSYKEA
jgi:hypothetical protein